MATLSVSPPYSCQRCQKTLAISASLQRAISTFDQAQHNSAAGATSTSGESSSNSPTASSFFDTNSALAATGITGLLGVSTYDVIPRQPTLSPRQKEKSRALPQVDEQQVQTVHQGAETQREDVAQVASAAAAASNVTAKIETRSKLIDLLNSHNPPEPTPRPSLRQRSSQSSNISWKSRGSSNATAHVGRNQGDGGDDHEGRTKDDALKIHHPLCQDCTEQLLDIMNTEIAWLRKERAGFLAFDDFVTEAEKERQSHGDQVEELDKIREEIRILKEEEEEAKKMLYESEMEKKQLEKDLKELEEEEKKLEEEEEDFWSEYNQACVELHELRQQAASYRQTIALDTILLERLEKTNVYNDAFSIGHDAGFATINGLRLGRSSTANVDWAEINAAWGQTVLLLDTLARKCGFVFKGYKLLPKGSFSYVEKLSGSAGQAEILELYNSSTWTDTLTPWGKGRSYNRGMEAFLDCLKQFMDYASDTDDTLRLPHVINKDKIGEASIRMPSMMGQDDDTWTRALRHMLLTIKVLMSWVVNNVNDGGGPAPSSQTRGGKGKRRE